MHSSVLLYKISISLAPHPTTCFKPIHTHSIPTGHYRGLDCQRVRLQSAGVRVGPHVPQLSTRRTQGPLEGGGMAQGPLGRTASQLTQGPRFTPVCLHAHRPHPQRALLDGEGSDDGAEASMRKGVAEGGPPTPSGGCREQGQGTGDPPPPTIRDSPAGSTWRGRHSPC